MDADELEERYYLPYAAAFARGRLPELAGKSDVEAFRAASARELKLNKFKRATDLPRVRRVLAMLAQLAPSTLLDVGTGRGVFLWRLLDAFPELVVTCIDHEERRASDLEAIARGGLTRLSAKQMDVEELAFGDSTFDGVTILEVLEHVDDPAKAAREVLRVAKRFVVATVPSKADDNPEHVRLFDGRTLTALFEQAGARRVVVEHVLNHIVALALVR